MSNILSRILGGISNTESNVKNKLIQAMRTADNSLQYNNLRNQLQQHIVQPVQQHIVQPIRNDINQHITNPVQNYFQPTTQLRARDFVRELPSAYNTVNTGVKNLVVGALQQIPRDIATGLVSVDQARGIGNGQIVPTTKMEKLVLGNEPIKSYQTNRVNTLLQKVGASPGVATGGAVGLGLIGGVLDTSMFGSGEGAINKILPKLAEASKVEEVMNIAKKAGIALDEAKALKIAKETNMGKISEILGSKVGQASKEISSLSNEANPQMVKVVKPTIGTKERGLVTSVQETPAINAGTKTLVSGNYTPKPNEQLMGEAKALLTNGATIDFKNTQNLDQKVAATIQEAINLDKTGNHEAAAALYNNLSTHATELGRGVQAFSMVDKMSPEAISLSAAGKIKKYNLTAAKKIPELTGNQQNMISDAVNSIRNMTEGREKNIAINELNTKLSNLIPSSFMDKATTVWKAGLLTSLRTHERNLLGNATMLGSEVLKDIPGSAADALMSLRTGKRTMSNTLSGLRELGSKATRQQIKDLIFKGYDPSGAVSKFDVQRVTWENTPVQQALKKLTDAVFRPLGAEDKAFYNAAYARSLYDQAGAEAITAGKRGDSVFIKSLVDTPSENMLKTATADANYATFHDKNILSGSAASIKKFIKDQPGVIGDLGGSASEVLMPFTGVPSSIVEKTIAYSPIGLVKGAIKTGRVLVGQVPELQRQAAQEVGRGVIGTGLFGLGAYLMSKGLMTGQPKDAKEADLWAAQGKQANSILIGGKWYSINSIGPQNLVALAGAKYNEEMNKSDGSVGAYLGALGKDQLSQTFLAGVQGPLNAITDPARYGKSYVGNQLSSLIPNIVKDTSKAFDPNQRENNTVLDYLKNSIPGVRNTGVVKRDVLGNVMKQEPTGLASFYDLFNSKTSVNNPIVNELSRLDIAGENATPSKLGASQTVYGQKIKLTPEELDQLEQQSGGLVTKTLNDIISSPSYKSLDDKTKSTMLKNAVSDIKGSVKDTLVSGGTINADAITGKYKIQLQKDNFAAGDKNFQIIDGMVYRKSKDGNVTTQTEDVYNTQLNTAKLSQYKKSNNIKSWLTTASNQYDLLTKQLQDPSIDELDAIDIQNKIDTLTTEAQKYSSYGGFTKPKAAKKAKVVKIKPVSVKSIKGVKIKVVSAKTSAGSKSFKITKVSRGRRNAGRSRGQTLKAITRT